MILLSKKKKAAIFFVFAILFIGVGFLFNMGSENEPVSSVDILSGEIVYVDKSNESMRVLANQPDEFDGVEFLVKTKPETEYGALPGASSLTQLKDDGYAIISFSEFQEGDPIKVIIDVVDGSNLVAERINLEREISVEHVEGAQYTTRDLGGRILEKVEDGLIIEIGVPSEVLSEIAKIKTTPETKYRKFTPLEGVFGDDFTDDDLPFISYDDFSVGDVVLAYTELHRVVPNVKAGNYNIAAAIRLHPDGVWWPEEVVGFWTDNYFGEVLDVDSERKRIEVGIIYSDYYAGDTIIFNLEESSIFNFSGDSDEFELFFEDRNRDKLSRIEFIQIEEGDFINVNIGKDRHTSDYKEDSVIPVKEVIIGPEF